MINTVREEGFNRNKEVNCLKYEGKTNCDNPHLTFVYEMA